MTRETRIALFLMGELVAALRANHSDDLKDFSTRMTIHSSSLHFCRFWIHFDAYCVFAGDIGGANKLYFLIKGLIPGQFDFCGWLPSRSTIHSLSLGAGT